MQWPLQEHIANLAIGYRTSSTEQSKNRRCTILLQISRSIEKFVSVRAGMTIASSTLAIKPPLDSQQARCVLDIDDVRGAGVGPAFVTSPTA
jgi:hypothetical protein